MPINLKITKLSFIYQLKEGVRCMAVRKKKSSIKNKRNSKNKIPLDKYKLWLILGITVAVLLVLSLFLYSPVKDAVFGKAIRDRISGDLEVVEGTSCALASLNGCNNKETCEAITTGDRTFAYWSAKLGFCFSSSKMGNLAEICDSEGGIWVGGKCSQQVVLDTSIDESVIASTDIRKDVGEVKLIGSSAVKQTGFTGIYFVNCTNDATKDTSAIQKALDKKPGYILLSKGICKIDKTLYVLQTRGLRFEGQGEHWDGTKLEWQGSSNTPMFSLQGSREISFKHLLIQAGSGKTLESAFDVYNDCFHSSCKPYKVGSAMLSHGNQFTDLYIVGTSVGILKNGIRVRLPPNFFLKSSTPKSCGYGADCANDGHRFSNVQIGGYRGTGFLIEGVNSKGNLFNGCMCNSYIPSGAKGTSPGWGQSCVSTAGRKGPNGRYVSGAFSWYGGWAIANSDADFLLGSRNDVIIISGTYSEKSRMFLRTETGLHGQAFPVTIESCRFAEDWIHKWDSIAQLENKNGLVIDYKYNGPLVISGSKWGTLSSALTNLGICWRIPSKWKRDGGSFLFQGNSVASKRFKDFFTPETSCYYPTTQQSNMIKHWNPTMFSFVRMTNPTS